MSCPFGVVCVPFSWSSQRNSCDLPTACSWCHRQNPQGRRTLRAPAQGVSDYLIACRDLTQLPTKINPEKNTIRLTFDSLPEPSLLISMIMGDCIHNARSSLDHLWKRLGGDGNFPIFGDVHSSNNWLAQKGTKLKGVESGAHAIIDSLQPCHRGKDAPLHPISILNEL